MTLTIDHVLINVISRMDALERATTWKPQPPPHLSEDGVNLPSVYNRISAKNFPISSLIAQYTFYCWVVHYSRWLITCSSEIFRSKGTNDNFIYHLQLALNLDSTIFGTIFFSKQFCICISFLISKRFRQISQVKLSTFTNCNYSIFGILCTYPKDSVYCLEYPYVVKHKSPITHKFLFKFEF